MDIISAYQQVGSYRAAAELCGTTPKTVKRVVDKFEAGDAPPARVERAHNYDAVTELVAVQAEHRRVGRRVQGVEDRVIRGGRAVFSAAKIVLIEMSFTAMYDGQPLFEEVHTLLEECGLRLAGFKNQIDSVETGQPLFAHCFYRRPDGPPRNGR